MTTMSIKQFTIPMWWSPSFIAVAKEYAIAHDIQCPKCGW